MNPKQKQEDQSASLHTQLTQLLMDNGASVTKPSIDKLLEWLAARDAQHEVEIRQDEYLSAEEAWFNHNDDYFDNRASELEAQLSLNKKDKD